METMTLGVTRRETRGKGTNRRLRNAGAVPAVLYGRGSEATPLTIDVRELRGAVGGGHHAVLQLAFADEGPEAEPVYAVVKEIQTNPTRHQILHLDLVRVDLNVAIESPVGIELIGESAGVDEGGVLDQTLREVMVRALPREIPESLQLDVTNLGIGHTVTVADIQVPEGIEILDDPETTVASVLHPAALEEELEEAGLPEGFEPEVTEEGAEQAESGEEA